MIANDFPGERRIIWPKVKPTTIEMDELHHEREQALATARLEIKALELKIKKLKGHR